MPMQEQRDDKVTALAKATIDQLKTLLEQLKKEVAEKGLAEKKIRALLAKQFNQLHDKEEKKRLYKLISLYFHADKIESNVTQPIIAYLTSKDMLGTIQTILNDFQSKNSLFDALTENPKNKLLRIQGYISKINFCKDQISKNPNLDELETRLQIEKENFKKFSPTWSLMLEMEENLDRYFQPLKFLIQTSLQALSYGVLLSEYIISVILWLPKFCLDALTAIHTGGGFLDVFMSYVDDQYAQARATYLDQLKDMDEKTVNMDDEEFIMAFKQTTIIQNPSMRDMTDKDFEEAFINKPVFDNIYNAFSGTIWLKLIAKSFYEVLTQPLPEGIMRKTLTLFLWLPRLLTAIPLFLLALIQTGFDLIAKIMRGIISNFVRPVILLGACFVSNIPLILWDAPGYLIRKIKNCCCAPKPSSADEDEPLLSSSQRRVSAALSSTQLPGSPPSPNNSSRQQATPLHKQGSRESSNGSS
ncbi:MAG: hypothetical protein K0R24_390, partial [Gammaproteobacteria bacterium]|nr:hypothetical protein [Gammaproteobacteria bacterium]